MKMVQLEMTLQQYADLREALAYLRKQLNFNPAMRDDCTLTIGDLSGLLTMMSEQVNEIDLVLMLVAEGRENKLEGSDE